MSEASLEDALSRLQGASTVKTRGRVTALTGLVMRAMVPGLRVGDHVRVLRGERDPIGAEVVGFKGEEAVLMPLGESAGIGPDSLVESSGAQASLLCGDSLLGRVIDGLGEPMDGRGPVKQAERWPLQRAAPDPLRRPRITRPLELGLRAIDGLLTVGEGQRVGLFSGSGVGKSTLLGQIARHADVDVCVVCLVGERGREVREFIEDSLGEGLSRSVVVCATSDAPPLVRLKSAQVATAVAEYFRARGRRVLLLMDSLTRYARALREVGLASGEPPARRGFPPSVFAELPRLLERTGNEEHGSITALYTVLVEGGDMEEPVADEVRGILDGHIVLSRQLGQRGHFPAIDVLQSISRVMTQIAPEEQLRAAASLRALIATYERQRDLIVLGAYQKGSDPATDRAISKIEAIEAFLRQAPDEHATLERTQQALLTLLR